MGKKLKTGRIGSRSVSGNGVASGSRVRVGAARLNGSTRGTGLGSTWNIGTGLDLGFSTDGRVLWTIGFLCCRLTVQNVTYNWKQNIQKKWKNENEN